MFPLLVLLSATSVQAWGVDPIFMDDDEDSDVHIQPEVEVAVDQHGSSSRLVRREAAHSLYESSGSAAEHDQNDFAIHKQANTETAEHYFAIHKQANTGTAEKVQEMASADSMIPTKFGWYKFTVTDTRGGNITSPSASYSKFVLQNIFGQEMNLSQKSSAEVYTEGDFARTDAMNAVNGYQEGDVYVEQGDSLIIRLKQKDAIGSYYWITSRGNPGNDPTAWSLSGSRDGENWVELSAKYNYPTPVERHVIVGYFILSRIAATDVVHSRAVQPCEKEETSTTSTAPPDQPEP